SAAAATATGAARIARIAISRPARARLRPPWRISFGTAGGPEAWRPRLVIRRWCRQGAQHADAHQQEHDSGHDHEDVYAVSQGHRESQEREEADDRKAAAED